MLAGSYIAYKSKSKPTIVHSMTEAEFSAAIYYSKIAQYLRIILNELGITQDNEIVIIEENAVAIAITNTQNPKRRTSNAKINHFALLQWC